MYQLVLVFSWYIRGVTRISDNWVLVMLQSTYLRSPADHTSKSHPIHGMLTLCMFFRECFWLYYSSRERLIRIYTSQRCAYLYTTEPGGQQLFGQSDIAYVVYRSDISIDFVSVKVMLSNICHILVQFPSFCAGERSKYERLGSNISGCLSPSYDCACHRHDSNVIRTSEW